MANIHIFLSTVSAEFRSYRDALRHDLDRPNVAVKVQEDFIASGTETLDKLDDYIRQCDAVIHLVGDMSGAGANATAVAAIRQRYTDLAQRLPVLAAFLIPGAPALSYTQWEAWLALYHRKRLIIAVPQEGAPRHEYYILDPRPSAPASRRTWSVWQAPGVTRKSASPTPTAWRWACCARSCKTSLPWLA